MADFNLDSMHNSAAGLSGATDAGSTDLALKIYAETLEAFTRTTVMESRVLKKTISSGKSAQFVVVGKADGTDNKAHDGRASLIEVTDTPFTERTVIVGYPIYSAKRLDDWQEQMAHYATRSLVTNYMGEDLAIQLDVNLMTLVNYGAVVGSVNAPALDASFNLPVTGYTAATKVTAGTPKARGTELMYGIYELRASIRGNDYNGEIVAFVAPTEYDALVLSEILVNSDVTNGNGGLDSGRIGMVGGVTVIETNSLVAANAKAITAWTSKDQSFAADTTIKAYGTTGDSIAALVMGRDAIAMVSLIGLVTDNDTEVDRLGATLMTAKYAYGANAIRPELCGRVLQTN